MSIYCLHGVIDRKKYEKCVRRGTDVYLALRAHDDSPIGQVLLFKIEDEFEDTTIPVLIRATS